MRFVGLLSVSLVLVAVGCSASVSSGGPEGGGGAEASDGSSEGGSFEPGLGGGGSIYTGSGGEPSEGGSPPSPGEGGFGPNPPYEEPSQCRFVEMEVTASELSPTDGCKATYSCGDDGVVLDVTCDGENDGTNTSLCSCNALGAWKHGGLVEGEGADACLNAYANCLDPGCCE